MTASAISQGLPALQAAWDTLSSTAQQIGITFDYAEPTGAVVRTQDDTNYDLAARQADYNAYVKAFLAKNPGGTPLGLYDSWDTNDKGEPAPRPIAPWGSSFHDFGAAFDILPTAWPTADFPTKGDALDALGGLADAAGLRWGGNFPGNSVDPRHFELDESLSQAQSDWSDFTGGTNAPPPASGATTPLILLGVAAAAALGLGVAIYRRRHGAG